MRKHTPGEGRELTMLRETKARIFKTKAIAQQYVNDFVPEIAAPVVVAHAGGFAIQINDRCLEHYPDSPRRLFRDANYSYESYGEGAAIKVNK